MYKRLKFAALTFLLLTLTACGTAIRDYYQGYGAAFVRDAPPPSTPAGDHIAATHALVAQMINLVFEGFENHEIHENHNQPLALRDAQTLLDKLHDANPIRIGITDENAHMPISLALWTSLYIQLLENMGGLAQFGIRQLDAVILATPDINTSLPAGHIVTTHGHFNAGLLDFTPYLDNEVALLLIGGNILAPSAVQNPAPTLQNAFIAERGTSTITIFAHGIGRTFDADRNMLRNLPQGQIADITISSGQALAVYVLSETITGAVLELSNGFLEIEGLGRLSIHEGFAIYSLLSNPVSLGRPHQITIGYDVAEFVKRDGQIAAAIILRRPVPGQIRVVLSTTGFHSRIHEVVELRSAGGLEIHAHDGITQLAPGEIFRLSYHNAYLLGGGRLTIKPLTDDRVEILTITRNWPGGANPQYRGILEITHRDGGFTIVNQLPLEQYLYAVIPSEMPTVFGLEPAKAQAVTARSYAYNQFFANRFYRYGANICDSVMTQVYNNIPETELARQATRATAGLVLAHNGQVVSTNYFSTSAGHTADRGDVWVNFETGLLDAQTPVYLAGMPQNLSIETGNLWEEEAARAFFTNTTLTAFDSQSPWFRWHFTLTNYQLARIINQNLPALSARSPQHFQRVGQAAVYPPHTIYTIGDFVSLEVLHRGRGGNIGHIQINGTEAAITVRTEYLIRRLLTPSLPEGIPLHRHAGAAPVNNHFILPSTFLTFDAGANSITFHGGGFGHGVGMSQHGAYGMSRAGYDFASILAHFYPQTQLIKP
ncbi:MAG: SpoIID/LytB domain-containing protein [Defluviitaleaceae bacterium]|nr:SpoIID/LytB domain-containing protein [Defluviitaleaceae bacterium]